MTQIDLYFRSCAESPPALVEVAFRRAKDSPFRRTVRGKFCYIVPAGGSFQWTRAVKALTVLLLRTAVNGDTAAIQGDSGTLAASLDYALSKEPAWLCEMFGADAQGRAFARRLFRRTNPERKRSGPVTINVNPTILNSSCIGIYVDGEQIVASCGLLQILRQIEIEDGLGPSSHASGAIDPESPPREEPADKTLAAISDLLERCSPSRSFCITKTSDGLITSFTSLAEADAILPALMDICTNESRGSMMFWYLHHAWWPLISPLYCFRHTEASKSVQTNVCYVSPSSGATDRYVSNFYANSGVTSRLGASAFLEHDTWFFNNYIVEQAFPPELRREIDVFLGKCQTVDGFNPVSFIRNFLEADANIELRVRKVADPSPLRTSFEHALRW